MQVWGGASAPPRPQLTKSILPVQFPTRRLWPFYLHNPSWNFRNHSPVSRMEERTKDIHSLDDEISQNLLTFPWAELSYLATPIFQGRQLEIGGSNLGKVDDWGRYLPLPYLPRPPHSSPATIVFFCFFLESKLERVVY